MSTGPIDPAAYALWYQINVAGVENANKQIDSVSKKMDNLGKRTLKVGQDMKVGLNYASTSIIGFATAGSIGTVEGERLRWATQRLSREVASVFLPVIEKATQWVEKTVTWFQDLNKAQQDNLMTIGMWIIGINGAIWAFGKLKPILYDIWKLLVAMQGLSVFGGKGLFGARAGGALLGGGFATGVAAGAMLTAPPALFVGALHYRGDKGRRSREAEVAEGEKFGYKDERITEHLKDRGGSVLRDALSQNFSGLSKEAKIERLQQWQRDAAEQEKYWRQFEPKGFMDKVSAGLVPQKNDYASKNARFYGEEGDISARLMEQVKAGTAINIDALKKHTDRRDIAQNVSGFEGLTSTFGRVQEQLIKYTIGGGTDQAQDRHEEMMTVLEEIATNTSKDGGVVRK